MKTVTFDSICEHIPDLEEKINNKLIKVIPLKRSSKAPKDNAWNTKDYSLTTLKKHKGNFGIIPGFNHTDCSLAIVDIDGYTIETEDKHYKEQIKKQTADYIYDCLKDVPNCMLVETQSGGHHLYLFNKTISKKFHETSKHLHFPSNFAIKELAGKSLKHSIEIFTKEGSKQCLLPGCMVFNKSANKENGYKVISSINHIDDIDVVDNINETIKNHLINKGFTYSEPHEIEERETKKSSYQKPLKEMKKNEIKEVTELLCPLLKKIDGSKHQGTLFLGGYFSENITKSSCNKICNNIINSMGEYFDNSTEFKKTMLQNYDKKDMYKAGLPSFVKLVEEHDPNFNSKKFYFLMNKYAGKHRRHTILLRKKNSYQKKYLSIDYDNKEIGVYTWNKAKNGEIYHSDAYVVMNIEPLEFYECYNVLDKQASPQLCFTYYRKGMPFKQTIKGNDIESIERQLKKRGGIVLKPREYNGLLNEIIREYVELDQIHIMADIQVKGVFINPMTNELARADNEGTIPIIKPSVESIKKGLTVWDKLYKSYKGDKTKLSHILRFGIRCPFSYIFKTDYQWQRLLFLYGVSQTAKTTLAEIALSLYTVIDDEISIGGSSADSDYRMGNALSRQGIGCIINEPSNVIERNSAMLDLLKRAVENRYCREKMEDGVHVKIPAYSNIIFTSNHFIPSHDAFIRRSEFIEFTKSERMDEKDKAQFYDRFHHTNWRETDFLLLRPIGDFFIWYISENMQLLKCNPTIFVDSLLDALFEYIGYDKDDWNWIYQDTELMDLTNSDDDIIDDFRNMVMNDYKKNVNKNLLGVSGTVSPPADDEQEILTDEYEKNFKENLSNLIKFKIINYLIFKDDNTILVRGNVGKALRKYSDIQITGTALADLLNKEYKNYKIKGKTMKGFTLDFEEFIQILK